MKTGQLILSLILASTLLGSCETKTAAESNLKEAKEQLNTATTDIATQHTFVSCVSGLNSPEEFLYLDTLLKYVKSTDISYSLDRASLKQRKADDQTNSCSTEINSSLTFQIFQWSYGNVKIHGRFVEYFGGNDIPGVRFELLSRHESGENIDTLVIFDRFRFELVLKKNPTIETLDRTILVESIEEDWITFDKSGEIVGSRDEPLIQSSQLFYEINNKGVFMDLSKPDEF